MKILTLKIMVLALLAMPLLAAESVESKTPQTTMRAQFQLMVKDQDRGLNFELHPDGKIELTVKEDGEKSYKANSLDEFKILYPEIAKKYQIDRFIPRTFWGDTDSLSSNGWNDWKKWFGNDWFWDKTRNPDWMKEWWQPLKSDDLDNWIEDQQQLFSRFRDIPKPTDPLLNPQSPTSSPAFGLRIAAVSESLANQLGLKEGEGILVVNVLENTPAQRAGIKKHDIILNLNSKVINDRGEFRRQVRELITKGFEIGIIRQCRHETIKVAAEKI